MPTEQSTKPKVKLTGKPVKRVRNYIDWPTESETPEPPIPQPAWRPSPDDWDSRSWLPKHVFVARSEHTARLLDLEQQLSALVSQTAVERQRVVGLEPHSDEYKYAYRTGKPPYGPLKKGEYRSDPDEADYYNFALPQVLFDLIQGYGQPFARHLGRALLFSCGGEADLSEKAHEEVVDQLGIHTMEDVTRAIWGDGKNRLVPYEGTYVVKGYREHVEQSKEAKP